LCVLAINAADKAGSRPGRVSPKSCGLASRYLFHSVDSMVVRSQSSAAGVLALLQEPDPLFKQHALKALGLLVPQFWAEISEHIALMFVFQTICVFRSSLSFLPTAKHSTNQTNFRKKLVPPLLS
jgi:hypothetical protein